MSYLDHLPAVFREADATQSGFLSDYLSGFEAVLTGAGEPADPALEELLDGIGDPDRPVLTGLERYFSPLPPADTVEPGRHQAPAEFLTWLATWVALVLRADVSEAKQRLLIANAVPLYRERGTRRGLEKLLKLYDVGAVIEEGLESMQIGVHSTIGVDTRLGGGTPHHFRIRASIATPDPDVLEATRERIAAIVDAEKPAHTSYDLVIDAPEMQIGVRSTIGVDTMLGSDKPS